MSRVTTLREERRVVQNAADFGCVAVMLGGTSPEREVSLNTGAAVLAALQARGVDAHAWDPGEKPMAEFAAAGFDRVWIALHGTGGEDGALQGTLQWLGVPYTGSGVMASALAMDKIRSKHLFEASGIPTPEYAVIRHEADAVLAAEELGFPMILKPAGQGSSVGMSKVETADELPAAWREAAEYDDCVLVERWNGATGGTGMSTAMKTTPTTCFSSPDTSTAWSPTSTLTDGSLAIWRSLTASRTIGFHLSSPTHDGSAPVCACSAVWSSTATIPS